MKVWIDQDLCTGDGLCEEIAPSVFTLLDDGLAYVKEGDKVFSDPGGAEGLANVPAGMEEADDRVRRGVPRRVHLHRGRLTLSVRSALPSYTCSSWATRARRPGRLAVPRRCARSVSLSRGSRRCSTVPGGGAGEHGGEHRRRARCG